MTPEKYFSTPQSTTQKQYEALRQYFLEGHTAAQVSSEFGYTYRGFTTIVSDFRKKLKQFSEQDPFFYNRPKGRKPDEKIEGIKVPSLPFGRRIIPLKILRYYWMDRVSLSAKKQFIIF